MSIFKESVFLFPAENIHCISIWIKNGSLASLYVFDPIQASGFALLYRDFMF